MNLLYTHASAFGIFFITCKRLVRTCPLFAFKYNFFLSLSPNSNKEKPTHLSSLLISLSLSLQFGLCSEPTAKNHLLYKKIKNPEERGGGKLDGRKWVSVQKSTQYLQKQSHARRRIIRTCSPLFSSSLLSSQYPPSSPYFIFSENTPQFLSFYLLISFQSFDLHLYTYFCTCNLLFMYTQPKPQLPTAFALLAKRLHKIKPVTLHSMYIYLW